VLEVARDLGYIPKSVVAPSSCKNAT
jgi:hypothetical protein